MKGPSCLGLDLHIENSMDILSFEFPSVRADVENYQSCSEGSSVKEPWISPDGHPEVSILVCQIVRYSEANMLCM